MMMIQDYSKIYHVCSEILVDLVLQISHIFSRFFVGMGLKFLPFSMHFHALSDHLSNIFIISETELNF